MMPIKKSTTVSIVLLFLLAFSIGSYAVPPSFAKCTPNPAHACTTTSSSSTTSTTSTTTSTTTSSSNSGSNFYYVGAQASASLPANNGVYSVIQVMSTTVTTGCLSFWVSDDSAANIWVQVGYYICSGSTSPFAFYEIWNLNTIPYTALASNVIAVSLGNHNFSAYDSSGTTWSFAVDGAVFGTYDMKASTSLTTHPIQALSEEGSVNTPFSFPAVSFSSAINYKANATWNAASYAAEPYGNPLSYWGIQGMYQNAALPINDFVVGGNIAQVNAGTGLW